MPPIEFYAWNGTALVPSLFAGTGTPVSVSNPRSSLVAGNYLPDATNTGAITPASQMQVINGDLVLSTNDQVITKKLILGNLINTAKRNTVRDCIVRGSVDSTSGSSTRYQPDIIQASNPNVEDFLVEDVTVDPSYGSGAGPGAEDIYRTRFARNGFFGHHTTLRRVNIAYTIDGISVVPVDGAGNRADVRVEGTWVHDLTMYSPDSNSLNWTHNDCIQWHGGKGFTVDGARLDGFLNTLAGDALVDRGAGAAGNPYYPLLHIGGSPIQFNQIGSRDAPDEFILRNSWVNGGAVGLNMSSAPNGFLAAGSSITGTHFGYDWRLDRTGGQGYPVLAKANQVFTLANNYRWGATFWLEPTATDPGTDSGAIDPFDSSVAYNVRRNG